MVSFDTSEVDKKDKFPSLLKFLLNHKRAIEYDSSNIRSKNTQSVGGAVHLVKVSGRKIQNAKRKSSMLVMSKGRSSVV